MTRERLFAAGEDGYKTYRIPALIAMPDGTELTFCEGRREASDWAPMALRTKRRKPGGDWGPAADVAISAKGPVHNPVPFRVKGCEKRVGLMYGRDYNRAVVVFSDDFGESWSEETDISAVFEDFRNKLNFVVFAAGPGGAAYTSGGRLCVPVWVGAGTESNGHGPTRTATIFSDDGGRVWKAGGIIGGNFVSPSESQIAVLRDGRLLMSIRNGGEEFLRIQSLSADGGESWSEPRLVETLVDPACQGSVCSLPDGSLIYSGPQCREERRPSFGCRRRKGSLMISEDDGASWKLHSMLEEGNASYSALAISTEGEAVCLFEVWQGDNSGEMSIDLFRIKI